MIYLVSFGVIAAIVNLPFEATNFQYSPEMIFNNSQFNALLAVLATVGIISAVLSVKPTVSMLFRYGVLCI